MRGALGFTIASGAVVACSLFTDLRGFDDPPGDRPVDARADDEPLAEGHDAADAGGGGPDAFVVPDAPLGACPDARIADQLIAFYPLDEGAGSTITDCSPSGLHGALIGDPARVKWVPGHSATSGTAVDLDGEGACFEIGPAKTLDFAGRSFSIAAWVKPRRFPSPENYARYAFSRETTMGALRGWHFGTDDPSSIELDVVQADGGPREIAQPIAANQWTHVAVVFTGALALYVNGVIAKEVAGPYVLAEATTASARLGCKSPTTRLFDGALDDVRIYARALSAAEITSLAQP